MNRVKYKFHPSEYELEENEKFYSDMEAKGWRLVKRGGNLSKFTPVEPSRIRYRVEVSSSGLWEVDGPAEGQLAVFEDCGWEYVASRGFLHIFRAPEGSGAPEFYSDPAQQAQTLKKVRRDLWVGWIITLLALAFAVWVIRFSGRPWSKVFGEHFKRFVQMPAHYAFHGSWILWAIYQAVWSVWKIDRTYIRLKRGRPLDHAPKRNRVLHKLFHPGLLCLSVLFVLLLVIQIFGISSTGMPEQADGPYLLLSDFGLEGERTDFMGQRDNVTYTSSLLAGYWDTVEHIHTPEDKTISMYQDVYQLRFPSMADTLARAMMNDSILADNFELIDVEGFDAVWAARYELVAVKGDMVAFVESPDLWSDGIDCQAVCAALRARWAVLGNKT